MIKMYSGCVINDNYELDEKQSGITLYHDFIHAWQKCYKIAGLDEDSDKKKNKCGISVCIEIQAYYNADCAHHPEGSEAQRKCVRDGIGYSSKRFCWAGSEENTQKFLDESFKLNYEKCAKKLAM